MRVVGCSSSTHECNPRRNGLACPVKSYPGNYSYLRLALANHCLPSAISLPNSPHPNSKKGPPVSRPADPEFSTSPGFQPEWLSQSRLFGRWNRTDLRSLGIGRLKCEVTGCNRIPQYLYVPVSSRREGDKAFLGRSSADRAAVVGDQGWLSVEPHIEV